MATCAVLHFWVAAVARSSRSARLLHHFLELFEQFCHRNHALISFGKVAVGSVIRMARFLPALKQGLCLKNEMERLQIDAVR
jgi:hypothetical protein